jgi:hypothetical protein
MGEQYRACAIPHCEGGESMKKDIVSQTIEDLVTRARLGDQVASASLVVIGQRADKGESRAIEIRKKVLEYTKLNPQKLQQGCVFGIDKPEKQDIVGDACLLKRNLHTGNWSGQGLAILLLTLGDYAVGVLAHGPSLLMLDGQPNQIVCSVRDALQSDHLTSIFDFGNENTNKPKVLEETSKNLNKKQLKALALGSILGRARRLQAVTYPNVPIAILCEDAAWELE